jgi:hypothetical protein
VSRTTEQVKYRNVHRLSERHGQVEYRNVILVSGDYDKSTNRLLVVNKSSTAFLFDVTRGQ